MEYRHYIGYIPKKDLSKILEEAERLKSLVGKPREDDEDETYSMYEVTSYLRDQATTILELGKLYWKNTEPIVKTLYDNKGEDYSNEDTEFFFVNDPDLLRSISFAQMDIWCELMKKWQLVIDKVFEGKEKLSTEEQCDLVEISKLFESEAKNTRFSKRNAAPGVKSEWNKPYSNWQFNYAAVETFQKYMDFDNENNVLCVYAY